MIKQQLMFDLLEYVNPSAWLRYFEVFFYQFREEKIGRYAEGYQPC